MTLICILLGLGLEYYSGDLGYYRKYYWFDRYCDWLETNFTNHSFWNGAPGVSLTLFLPLFGLFILGYLMTQLPALFLFIFVVGIFIYGLGPSVNNILNTYLEAMEQGDESLIRKIENELIEDEDQNQENIYCAILIRAHDYLFGALFWFIALGILGIFLFCLVNRLKTRYSDIHGDYAEAVRNLYMILIWPSSRLLALGFALGGSLVDALEGWRSVEGISLDKSRMIIINSGLGAIQHRHFQNEDADQHIETIQQLQALINRSLIVWLTILGVMTIGGWLS